MAKKSKNEPETPGFEELLEEAETLAGKIEEGGLSLDESIGAYEKGVENLRRCADLLKAAEEKVQVLLEKNGSFRLEALDPEEEAYGESAEEDDE